MSINPSASLENPRITSTIEPTGDNRWRVTVQLDGYDVERAFPATYHEACEEAGRLKAAAAARAGIVWK